MMNIKARIRSAISRRMGFVTVEAAEEVLNKNAEQLRYRYHQQFEGMAKDHVELLGKVHRLTMQVEDLEGRLTEEVERSRRANHDLHIAQIEKVRAVRRIKALEEEAEESLQA